MTTLKRTLYCFAAVLAIAVGLLGLLIPVIPGVLFLLVALVLLASVSSRVRNRLYNTARIRPYLVRWEAASELPIGARVKLGLWLLYATATDSLRSVAPSSRS